MAKPRFIRTEDDKVHSVDQMAEIEGDDVARTNCCCMYFYDDEIVDDDVRDEDLALEDFCVED